MNRGGWRARDGGRTEAGGERGKEKGKDGLREVGEWSERNRT